MRQGYRGLTGVVGISTEAVAPFLGAIFFYIDGPASGVRICPRALDAGLEARILYGVGWGGHARGG